MAEIVDNVSRTFQEYLLLPGLSRKEHTPERVNLRAGIQKHKIDKSGGAAAHMQINLPIVSAAMQAVTGPDLAIALARKGGCGFIYCSQSPEAQAEMVRSVKVHKAGFVESDSNLSPGATLQDALSLRERTGHSTIAITENGGQHSKLLGILTSKDFWEFKDDLSDSVGKHMTPIEKLVLGKDGISLQEATDLLWRGKKECLPIIDKTGCLRSLVFRKDYYDHKTNPDELTDDRKRLFVGGALNTFDFRERSRLLVDAGADCLCLDSSDGYSDWQKEAALWLRREYGTAVTIGGGNVVSGRGFRFLVEEADLDFVKIGIGGGSICITREQKGIGRGQASAVLEVAAERDRYFEERGIYVPLCSDGGLANDTQIIMALALGADFVMMGRYFAMTAESPTETLTHRGRLFKPYWGEGSNRARNWQRYSQTDRGRLVFEEGVDAYVPYSGPVDQKLTVTASKLRAAMCNAGVLSVKELHREARVTRVSEMTLVEGGTSNVKQLDRLYTEE